jgi:hypothetical protein
VITDDVGFMEMLEVFICFLLKIAKRMLIINQDCNSVIDLVMKGGEVVGTKNTRPRMKVGREAILEERIKVSY